MISWRSPSAYASGLPQLLSLECWGGATFDVSMRFLTEDPWERLALLREKVPNILTQMLLRGANGVGYTNYPDNVVRHFVRAGRRAPAWTSSAFSTASTGSKTCASRSTPSAKPASSPKARSATPAIFSIPTRTKYSLRYYVDLAKDLERAGCHILGLKDMAGLLKPAAARVLVKALREEVGLPIHLHTHDTSGISGATRAGRGRSGRGCDRRGDGRDVRRDLAALPRLACRSLRHTDARYRARSRGDPPDQLLLGGGARPVRRLRNQS